MADSVRSWLERAESAYNLGIVKKSELIFYEDLCFQLQQACEKALKAVLIYMNSEPPKTHTFGIILQEIEDHVSLPDSVKEVITLNNFAVQMRYPGDYVSVEEDEYLEMKGNY